MWRLHLQLRLTSRISTALCLIKVETVSARELFMGGGWSWNNCSVMSSSIKISVVKDTECPHTVQQVYPIRDEEKYIQVCGFAVFRKHCIIRLAIGHVSGGCLRNACSCGRKTARWNWLECRCLLFNLTFLCNIRARALKKQERQQPNML